MLEELTSSEAVYYMDEILQAIEKEKLPNEGDRGLMVYFDEDKAGRKGLRPPSDH